MSGFAIRFTAAIQWLVLGIPLFRATCGAAELRGDWLHLDNGQIRLGVDRSAGASIGFFGERATGRNLLNHYDKGRFIQQSYYGAPDGSDWNGKPWRWNPVQGGGWRGEPARTLAFTNTATTLYAKTLPKHWATGTDVPAVTLEEWLTLTNRIAHLRFRMTYTGVTSHPPAHQELPAVYTDHALTNLVYYKGTAPWTGGALTRRRPGLHPPNEYDQNLTENWAAYVDARDWGLGVFTPGTTEMTFFRSAGKSGPAGSGCSYFAPIRTLAITNGFTLDYDVFLAIGTVEELRGQFRSLTEELKRKPTARETRE